MSTREEIETVQADLAAWATRQPPWRRAIASRIIGHLNAVQIGARPNPWIKAQLLMDIAITARDTGLSRRHSSQRSIRCRGPQDR